MTIVHNAYGFDFASFERALLGPIEEASEGDATRLNTFALERTRRLAHPDTKRALDPEELDRAIHEEDSALVAEACMTAFYDVGRNAGVGFDFGELDRVLDRLGLGDVLFGPSTRSSLLLADMGMTTSCLFDAREVEALRRELRSVERSVPAGFRAKINRLLEAGRAAGGLYVSLDFVELPRQSMRTGALYAVA